MHTDIMGDDLLGDDLLGDDDVGAIDEDDFADFLVGDDLGDDLMGDTDIVGDDLVGDYLVGAAKRKLKRRGRAVKNAKAAALLKKAMLAKRLKSAKLVHSRGPTKSRIQSIGFTRAAVPPNTTAELTARPQVLFRGTRLLVGSSIAQNFVIEDIKVGRN